MKADEMAIYLLNNAIKQTVSVSYIMKIREGKEIVINQLAVAKMFLFDACIIDEKHCKKTLLYIMEIKNELEKLKTTEDEILSN